MFQMFLFQFLFVSLNPADLTVTQSSGWSASVNESIDASLYWSSVSFLHHFFLTVNWFTNFISHFFFVFFSILLFLFPCCYFFFYDCGTRCCPSFFFNKINYHFIPLSRYCHFLFCILCVLFLSQITTISLSCSFSFHANTFFLSFLPSTTHLK